MRSLRKSIGVFVVTVLLGSFFFAQPTAAAARYATCDACGLCPQVINGSSPSCTVNFVPGDWKSCVKCLYPTKYGVNSDPDPSTCDTLLIDDTTNAPKYPVQVGRQYTMLGCISAGTNVGFNSQSGAPSFVQAMLNVVFSLTGGIAFLYLMYGGFVFLTSQADPERLNYGRRLVFAAITGLLLTLGSLFLVNLIGAGILKIPGFSATP